ncbi:hypothetical protein Deipe_3552 [Deinococcus peraridilitoris DSM 19664]|uniref:Organic solvent tolerance-like N-terminal domain-containing protein n=2 Tax=Deinococcus TaxID=1298 RepID=L0A712_DEIPD|nr:hypothetical protein Deipe_3552 [Deinococcus peraridilitoris DSM 19664]
MITAALWGVSSAATFAGFSIKPYGDQKLNLQTGTTVLGKGGVASDAERGVSVDAKYIEFKEGDWLKARDAKLTTREGGTLLGQNVEYQAKSGILSASGNLQYGDARVQGLSARTISLDTTRKLAVAMGGVSSQKPAMSADNIVVDYANNRAVMFGNYQYSYNRTKLSSAKADAVLLVTWNALGQPSASTKVSEAQIAPYRALLK